MAGRGACRNALFNYGRAHNIPSTGEQPAVQPCPDRHSHNKADNRTMAHLQTRSSYSGCLNRTSCPNATEVRWHQVPALVQRPAGCGTAQPSGVTTEVRGIETESRHAAERHAAPPLSTSSTTAAATAWWAASNGSACTLPIAVTALLITRYIRNKLR